MPGLQSWKGVSRSLIVVLALCVPVLVIGTRVATTADAPQFARVETVAGAPGALRSPAALAVDPESGAIYVADADHHQIRAIAADGTVAVLAGNGSPGHQDGAGVAAMFRGPRGIAFDAAQRVLYVADTGNHVIRRVTADGTVTTIAGLGRPAHVDGTGLAAGFHQPTGLALHGGALYVADTQNHSIRRIGADLGVTTIAGGGRPGSAGGPALDALFASPEAIAVDEAGTIWVADTQNHAIRRITGGVVTTVAGDKPGFADGTGSAARLHQPSGIAVMPWGDVIVADRKNDALRVVSAAGAVTTLAGGTKGLVDGPLQAARFSAPEGLAFSGALFVADAGNHAVRAIWTAPRIEAIDPASGPTAGGNDVTISGAGFVAGRTTVAFGDAGATDVRVMSSTQLVVTAPSGALGSVDVAVTTPGGSVAEEDGYMYVEAAKVLAVEPDRGPTAGGIAVTIHGSGFVAGQTAVKFGSLDATNIVVADSTHVGATVPAAAAGVVSITVTTPAGSDTLPNAFTYIPPPSIASFTPASGAAGTLVTITGGNFDPIAANNTVRFGGSAAVVVSATATELRATVPAGAASGAITVETAGGLAQSATPFVIRALTGIAVAPASATLQAGQTQSLTATASYSDATTTDVTSTAAWSTSDASIATVSSSGVVAGIAAGSATITASFSGFTATAAITVFAGTPGIPPDPALIAPPIDTNVITPFGESIRFLYTGNPRVQTDVATGAIDERRAGVLRGRVLDFAGQPLSGVEVTVHRNAQLGRTFSREDGRFDIAVNGGGAVTLSFAKDGYLTAQRTREVPWRQFVTLEDLVLVALDSNVTEVNLSSPEITVARGGQVLDEDGSRRATMMFTPGTTATMKLADGSTQPLPSLHVRATEYTVGTNGKLAMPAVLPPESGYTYCVELSADEAIVAGATRVDFSQPVQFYVENFLGFPVGTVVPTGYYDRALGAWLSSSNGRVVKILAVNGGVASVDTTGDGVADDTVIPEAERRELGGMYAAGVTLWRVPIQHFTPWDCNWPYGPPEDAVAPGTPGASCGSESTPPSGPDCASGSVINCQGRGVGEALSLDGTPFNLFYASDRTPGSKLSYTIEVSLKDAAVPASLKRIDLELEVAGRTIRQGFAPGTGAKFTIVWDGYDIYGRRLQGQHPVRGRIGYTYNARYLKPTEFEEAFSRFGNEAISSDRVRTEVSLWQDFSLMAGSVTQFDPDQALGGFTINAHHFYDPNGRTVYFGDGSRRSVDRIIRTVAGSGISGFAGDGGPATSARIGGPWDIAFGPDGSMYIADGGNAVVRRVTPDGIIRTIAGIPGQGGFSGDGGPATSAQIFWPPNVAVDRHGNVYIGGGNRIRKIDTNGIIRTIAGTGLEGDSGDGGPALQARFREPLRLTIGPDDSIYFVDRYAEKIRRVTPNGRIHTVAGGGSSIDDGAHARDTWLRGPTTVVVGPDGSIYFPETRFSSSQRIRRILPNGRVYTVAGIGQVGYGGDGGPARLARLNGPVDLALAADGSIYVTDMFNYRIRRISPDGIISTVAGTGQSGFSGDNGPASVAQIWQAQGIEISRDGIVHVVDSVNHRIRALTPPFPGMDDPATLTRIPSADGSMIFEFDKQGRHRTTRDAFSGAARMTFNYDGNVLRDIADSTGRKITVARSASAIVLTAPNGQKTTLRLGADGFASEVANDLGQTTKLEYESEGLVSRFENPRGHASTFTYDENGRLTKDENAAGGSVALDVFNTSKTSIMAVTTTRLGRATSTSIDRQPTGVMTRTSTGPDGVTSTVVERPDGTISTMRAGGSAELRRRPDPRFGMGAPVGDFTLRLPSGLTLTGDHKRQVSLTNPNDFTTLTQQTDTLTVNGRIYRTIYDKATSSITTRSPLGREVKRFFDAHGRMVRDVPPDMLPIDYVYDGAGRLMSATQGTRTYTFTYDALGELETMTDPAGRIKRFEHDSLGELRKQTDPDGKSMSFERDANGNLVSATSRGGAIKAFGYSGTDRATSADSVSYDYDFDGDVTGIHYADGSSLMLDYDTGARLEKMRTTEGTYQFTYNGENLASITTPAGDRVDHTHDGSLLTNATWSGAVSGSVGFTYDANFRVTTERVNGGSPVSFSYDQDGFLTAAGALTIARDALSGVTRSNTLGSTSEEWTLNGYGEVEGYTAKYNGSPMLAQTFVRDGAGRITSRTESHFGGSPQTLGYGYDDAGRLETVTGATAVTRYAYDPDGNRTSVDRAGATTSYTYDAAGRIATAGSVSYVHNAKGQIVEKNDGSAKTTYAYDGLGHLVTVTLPDATVVEYVYDGHGRRVGRKVNGTFTNRWVYSGPVRIAAELDANNVVVKRFVYGTRFHVPDAMIANGVTYRIVTDNLGSPRYVVDSATGAVAASSSFDEYGRVLSSFNPGFVPFGYAGGLYDPLTGLTQFGQREYDPETGRFTTEDPAGLAGGDLNPYGYVKNDPINWIDPLGWERLGLAANGPDVGAFRGRAEEGAGRNGTKTFNTGQDIRREMDKAGKLDRVDIHSHATQNGVVGNGADIGFYRDSYTNRQTGSTNVSEIADDIISGKIQIEKGGQINFYGCNTDAIAQELSQRLTAKGRKDIKVTGADDYVYPKGGKAWVDNKGHFNTYQGGKKVSSTRSRSNK